MAFDKHPMIGKWRITDMELWDAGFIDLLGPAYIEFDGRGGGEFTFGAVHAGLDCSYSQTSIHFTWEGSDDMEPVRGDGFADIEDDGTVIGEIRYYDGDESSFTAKRR